MAGPHSEALELLVHLDALDQELLELRAEHARSPVGLAEQRAEIASASEARDDIASRLAARQAEQRDHERDLEGIEKRADRAAKRLEALFVAEQISATEREIVQLGEQKDEQEFAILELMETIDGLSGQLDSANAAIARAEKRLQADQALWDAREPVVTGRITELEAGIADITPTVPAEALKAYRIGYDNRNNRHHRGATRTDRVMCVMCRTEVPARWVNEARRGEGIHRCPGCKRVLVGAAPKAAGEAEDEGDFH